MKTIPIAQSPTRSRALNVFLGMVLSLISVLLFLALATYNPADPSLNTAAGADAPLAVRNWIGPDGRRVHHLIDPSTREPARTGLIAVTVAGPA